MEVVFPVAAFAAAFLGTYRSLGLGLVAVFAVGYFNGVVRANYLGVFTTFLFDAAVFGLYLGFLLGHAGARAGYGPGGRFALLLIGWPVLLALIPVNDLLIQMVALRAAVWFLPVVLLASRLTGADLGVIARGLTVLNLCALAGGLYVYQNGVEALYPQNAVTQIIYMSKDVGGFEFHRIPSTFLSAHAYGGAMLFSLPFLLDRLFGPGVRWPDRSLAAAGVVAAAAGILMCAARQPVVLFAMAAVVAWTCTRFHPTVGLVAAGLFAAGLIAAGADDRLQRATTLDDPGVVTERVRGSANESFLELLADYPLGAGMGSAAGTSIPYFLADRAPAAVGLENEYSHILVDQGWIGLVAWLAFLGWLFGRPPAPRLDARWGLGVVLMYALVLVTWATAFIGAGTLTSVPGAVLLLTQMGVLVRVRTAPPPDTAGRA